MFEIQCGTKQQDDRVCMGQFWIGVNMEVYLLRAIDEFARSSACAASSMDPLIAHLSVDRVTIVIARSTKCAR